MSALTTLDRVAVALSGVLGLQPSCVRPEASFTALGADSLDQVEIIMEVEEAFGIEIPDADIDTLTTVAQMVAYVDARLAQQAHAPAAVPA